MLLIHKRVLIRDLLDQVIPPWNLSILSCQGFHLQGLHLGRTNVGTVSATSTIQYRYLDLEIQTCKSFTIGLDNFCSLGQCLGLILVDKEGTDGSMGTNIGTLVTLYAIVSHPLRHIHGDPALLILRSS